MREGVYFNEGNDYWYRVLKVVLGAENTRVGLLLGDYLRVREVQGSLSRKKYYSWREVEVPPIYLRLRSSKDHYDRLLMAMICRRWWRHSLQNITSRWQRVQFIYRYRHIYWLQLQDAIGS